MRLNRTGTPWITYLRYCIKLRATRIFLLSLFIWLTVFGYCQLTFWRDPHSAYFRETHVYDLDYSLYREREARHFISRHNSHIDPPDYVKSGPNPLVCASFVTVRREQDDYFDASVGSLLEGLDPTERRALHLDILFADTDPRRHASWNQNWVDRLADSAGTYNVSDAQREHLKELEKERNFYEKGVFDYLYALQNCQRVNASYTILFEDDIILATGWLSKTLKGLADLAQPARHSKASWLYLRLFYTETSLGWENTDTAYRMIPVIFGTLMLTTFFCLSWLRRSRWKQFALDYPSILVISLICVPSFLALVYMAGKYNLTPLRGVVEMNKSGCCTQAMLFPRERVDGLIEFLSERKHGQTDSLIEEYADQTGFTRYALAPPQLQHVGLKSSRDNLDINTQSTWAFWFETNDPARLRREHSQLLEDKDVKAMLSLST